jgi:hypothetical protein
VALRLSIAVALVMAAAASAGGDLDDATSAARKALAAHIDEDPARVTVERVEPARWPDWGLSCGAAPGAGAATVEGHRVFLRAGEKVYLVNVAGAQVRVCASFRASGGVSGESPGGSSMNQQPQPEPADPPSQALVAKARADLQRRLSVTPEEVVLVEFKAVVWPDSSLGCPRPDMVYTQVQRDGVLIRFTAQGRAYEYHGGSGRDPFLCDTPAG